MTKMAILQEVDKCMRCNGCVIACKRTWKMKNDAVGKLKVGPNQRLAIKSQKRIDMGPFLRFSCWHCPDPPCTKRCPFSAIVKRESGAVSIDPDLCNPAGCLNKYGVTPCVADCARGGYPRVGTGSYAASAVAPFTSWSSSKAWKCTLCYGRAGTLLEAKYGAPLPTRVTDAAALAAVPEKAHEPTCVYTCPSKAMTWDSRENINTKISTGYISVVGDVDGSMVWASKKFYLAVPKADPLIEDHISPLVGSLLSGPFAKAMIVPTLIAGGLFAISARKAANETASLAEGSVTK